jgi:hypothetical protein
MVLKFGPVVARNLRRRRPVRQGQWHIANNRAENSHPASAAKRAQDAGLKSAAAARRFVAVYAAVTTPSTSSDTAQRTERWMTYTKSL